MGRSRRELKPAILARLAQMQHLIGEAVIELRDQSMLFERVCRIAVEQGPFQHAWIGLVDPASGQHIPVAASDGLLENADRPAGRVGAAFPLLAGKRLIGSLQLYSDASGCFDQQAPALLRGSVDLLAFMLARLSENARHGQAEAALRLDTARQESLLKLHAMNTASDREIVDFALEEAVRLTNSKIGYLHFINADQLSLRLFTWSKGVREACYAESNTHYPLEAAGVWVDCVRQRQPVFHNDYQNLPNRKGYPEGHIPVMRHLSVPLIDNDQVVAVTGVGNKDACYDEADARQLLLFMSEMWLLLQRKRAIEALVENETRSREHLAQAVAESTRELRRERDRTQAILETLNEAVMVVDTDGVITYLNPAAAGLTGITLDQVLPGQPAWLDQEVTPLGPLTRAYATVMAGQPWQGELALRRADGSSYEAAVSLAPLFAPDTYERPVGFVSVQRDITELKGAERLKDQFVANVSHELRSPMALITMLIGGLETLYERLDDNRRREMIANLRKHTRVLNDLIGNVLEISRIDGGRIATDRQRLNISALLQEELNQLMPFIQRKQLTIRVASAADLPVVGHSGQLQQVIRNLLTNAIKYTPVGGMISCTAQVFHGEASEFEALDWPGASRLLPGSWVGLRISDTGIGIGSDDLPHLFERFYRAQTQGDIPGTGLGLSIAWELVQRHGGRIEVSSVLDQGSHFVVYLPLVEELV